MINATQSSTAGYGRLLAIAMLASLQIAGTAPATAQDGDILDFIPSILSGITGSGSASTTEIIDEDGNRCSLNEQQVAMLNMHNDARGASRQCGSTSFAAAAPLRWNCTISRTATSHSREMHARGVLTHRGSNGSDAGQRLTRAGYRWAQWGENIAAGRVSASGTMNQWLGSAPHCANLMDSGFREIGVANDGIDGEYWTAVFGRRP